MLVRMRCICHNIVKPANRNIVRSLLTSIKDENFKKMRTFVAKRTVHHSSALLAKCEQLSVGEYGDPVAVVHKVDIDISEKLENDQVMVRTLASPVNPADINTIQGVYAIKPEFPFVGGNEGVMEVVDKASNVKTLSIGDKVIPKLNAMGTWTSIAKWSEKDVIKIPNDTPIPVAATIAVNPCTAYRMLNDYTSLKPDDCIIQNCANSAVGQAVIQIAATMGVKTINVVRDRPNFKELEEFLLSLGATKVITDEVLRISKGFNELPSPKLGFNAASGKSGTDLLRRLANGGTMVTYGGMSRQPLTVSIGSLIFNDVTLKGFWMTRWNKVNEKKRLEMLDHLFRLVREGKFVAPQHELIRIKDYKLALTNAMPAKGKFGKKQILIFE